MTQSTSPSNIRHPASSGFLLVLPLAAGLAVALAVLAYLLLSAGQQREEENRKACLRSLEAVRANLDGIWDRAASFADLAARQLEAVDKSRLPAVAERLKSVWPEASVTLYDKSGEVTTLAKTTGGPPETEPLARTARHLVHAALVGQEPRAFTRSRGFLSLSAAMPVRAGEARALVVTVPLDSHALEVLKTRSGAHVGLIALNDGGAARDNFLEAVNTFVLAGGKAAALWTLIGEVLTEPQIPGPQVLSLSAGHEVGVAPLKDAVGGTAGLLFAAPLAPEDPALSLPRHILASVCAGLLAGLFSALCLRLSSRRLGAALAAAVRALEDGSAADGRGMPELFSAPLMEALGSVARKLRDYRNRIRTVEIERDAAGRKNEEAAPPPSGQAEDDAYLRLFENAPIGIFQAEANGRFLRVNQAFAMMLGYDTPVLLLAENPSFTAFCLYGDEIRNPLNALLEQGGGRQALPLRKRGGGIGSYALLSTPLPSATGDLPNVLECYLIDHELEEQTARAKRDKEFANRQRVSLALLLAATCLQTRSNLLQPQIAAAESPDQPEAEAAPGLSASSVSSGEGAGENAGGPDRRERRQSVLAVKAVLSDIYQIAMTEVSAGPPVDLPIDFGRFLRRLCRQTLPAMHLRGISLNCEVADELLMRLSGPAPLLRHALHRALLAVASPVRGGWASLTVMRDPNAPKTPGQSRVLFSASWSPHDPEPGKAGRARSGDALSIAPSNLTELFNAPAEAGASAGPLSELEPGTLELGAEQEVIRYLAQKMHGDLLEGVFTNEGRSLRIIVPLTHLYGLTGQAEEDAPADAPAPAGAEEEPFSPPQEAATDYADIAMNVMPADAPAPLNILVSDDVDLGLTAMEDTSADGERGLSILLVDDSLNNRLLFSLFLKDTKHRITEAHDGQEGVEAFQRGQFDVIFMDMEMPLMDGYQATRIIRALEADNDRAPTPIVGMTSYALPEFRRQCMLSGCSDFLSKPFSKIALFSILDAFSQLKEGGEHEE